MGLPLSWAVGDRCYVTELERAGKVEKIRDGFVTVRFEPGSSTYVPLLDLEMVPFAPVHVEVKVSLDEPVDVPGVWCQKVFDFLSEDE